MARILIVDDDDDILEILSTLLQYDQHEVLTAQDGQAAYDCVLKEELDMLIIDLMLPGVSGYQLCRMIRENNDYKHLLLMILSVKNDTENRAMLLSMGADAYLSKPFESEELIAQVNSLLRVKSLYNELDEKIEEAEKLNRTKNEFLSMVSHDLKSPLSAIISYSMLLRDGSIGAITEEQKEIVQIILNSSRTMFSLINDLLDVSKIEEGRFDLKITELDLAELAEMATDELGILCDIKCQELKFETDGDLPLIYGDFGRLKQVINNLLSNAIKFTPENGVITLRLRKKDDDGVLIEVADNGVGIPAKDLGVLFNRYQKSSAEGTQGEKGTGLGLAITKEIVEAHHGDIWIESKVNEGSTFFVFLPIDRRVTAKSEFDDQRTKLSIIAIEEDAGTVKAFEEALKDEFVLSVAKDTDKAMDMMEGQLPDLLIVDLESRWYNALEFIARIKEDSRWSEIPIVATTKKTSLHLKKEIVDTGCNGYLLKPFTPEELLSKVRELLRIERREQETAA